MIVIVWVCSSQVMELLRLEHTRKTGLDIRIHLPQSARPKIILLIRGKAAPQSLPCPTLFPSLPSPALPSLPFPFPPCPALTVPQLALTFFALSLTRVCEVPVLRLKTLPTGRLICQATLADKRRCPTQPAREGYGPAGPNTPKGRPENWESAAWPGGAKHPRKEKHQRKHKQEHKNTSKSTIRSTKKQQQTHNQERNKRTSKSTIRSKKAHAKKHNQ